MLVYYANIQEHRNVFSTSALLIILIKS